MTEFKSVVCGSHANINLKRHEPRTDDMTGVVCDMANLHLDWSKFIVSHSNKIRRSLLIEGPSMWIDKLAENKSFIYIGRQLVTGMKMIGIVIYRLLC